MTPSDLIDALGGPKAVADALGMKPNAVAMMKLRAAIPPRHYMAFWMLAKGKGVDWAPPGAPTEPAPAPPPRARARTREQGRAA